ncbi:hypothetical protein [Candidatus Oscillochloris fontis]|nr:hypothetical protein [Candidatus Oscillochloris fontis]
MAEDQNSVICSVWAFRVEEPPNACLQVRRWQLSVIGTKLNPAG